MNKECKLLKGKVALVSGAGQGMGREICNLFAKNGANLVLLDIVQKDIEDGARIVRKFGTEALPLEADISSYEEVKMVVKEALKYFGKIDILVNNAGLGFKTPVVNLNIDDWKKIFEINFFGSLYLSSEVIKNMIKNKRGNIINIASKCASQPTIETGAYNASKAALVALSETMSLEYKRYGLRVNSISPARVSTKRAVKASPGENTSNWIKPHEVANVALFLASDQSSALNGTEIRIFGNFYKIGTFDYNTAEEFVEKKLCYWS